MERRRWCAIALVLLMGSGPIYTAEQYMEDVLSGKQVACRYVKLAVERQLRDLARQETKAFPYYFDPEMAKRVIAFKQQLRCAEGEWAGERLRLLPWQQFKDWCIFGWRRVADGYRRFTRVYIEIARGNGKTTDGGATALYMFYADRPHEAGPQVYCVGPKKVQGKIAWKAASAMVKKHRVLNDDAQFFKENTNEPFIVRLSDPMAVMTVWGKDAETQDGFNPSFSLVDEAHLFKTNEALEVLESGKGKRRQPMTMMITTAGFDLSLPCYTEERHLTVQVLERTLDPAPEHFWGIIFTLDEGDDWTNPDVWVKANPSLGVTLYRNQLEERILDALSSATKQNGVKTKNLNIWTQAQTRWIQAEKWAACKGHVVERELAGRPCCGGLDLSTSIDLTAWVLCFLPLPEDPRPLYRLLYRFFMPEADILERERRDQVPYRAWVDQGLITLTPGETVDYDLVEDRIREDRQKFRLRKIGADMWKAHEISTHLQKEGFDEVVEYRQNFYGMALPTDAFEKATLDRRVVHNGNPVMTWMVGCTEVRSDGHGNFIPIKPDRKKTSKRIDGVVASIMAYHRAVLESGGTGDFRNEPAPPSTTVGLRTREF